MAAPALSRFSDGWRWIQPQRETRSWGGHAVPDMASTDSRHVQRDLSSHRRRDHGLGRPFQSQQPSADCQRVRSRVQAAEVGVVHPQPRPRFRPSPGTHPRATSATTVAGRVHHKLRHTSGTNGSDRTSIPAGYDDRGPYECRPSANHQAARHAPFTEPIHRHGGGLPYVSETLLTLCQYRSTGTDRKLIRAHWLLRR